jgi:hypothetical protein
MMPYCCDGGVVVVVVVLGAVVVLVLVLVLVWVLLWVVVGPVVKGKKRETKVLLEYVSVARGRRPIAPCYNSHCCLHAFTVF